MENECNYYCMCTYISCCTFHGAKINLYSQNLKYTYSQYFYSEIIFIGTYATRVCLMGGIWSDVDLTSCTLTSMESNPFMLVYLYLQENVRRKRMVEKILPPSIKLHRRERAASNNNNESLLMEAR